MKVKDRFNNVNNNKNVIYINLQKPTVKRRRQNKQSQEQQQSYNKPSDLYPTLYRPIVYDNSSPNMERPVDGKNVLGRGAEKSFISMGSPEEVVNVESNIDEIEDKQQEEILAGRNIKIRKKLKSAESPDKSPQIDFENIYVNDESPKDKTNPFFNAPKIRGRKEINFSGFTQQQLLEKLENDKLKRKKYAQNAKQKKELEKQQKLKEAEDKKRAESVMLSSDEIRAKRTQAFAPFVTSSTATNFR